MGFSCSLEEWNGLNLELSYSEKGFTTKSNWFNVRRSRDGSEFVNCKSKGRVIKCKLT